MIVGVGLVVPLIFELEPLNLLPASAGPRRNLGGLGEHGGWFQLSKTAFGCAAASWHAGASLLWVFCYTGIVIVSVVAHHVYDR